MSKWATISKRKTLDNFPCVEFGSCVTEKCAWVSICRQRRIYDEYIRLRDVVAAILEDASPMQEAELARTSAILLAEREPRSARRMIERAKAWEAIA